MSDFTFIEQSPSEGAEHSVEQGTTIGREGCDITLGDPDVSRRHAEIQISNGDLLINDLGSTNGTFVNGERIDQPRSLRDGDEVRIGAVVWRLRAPAGATRIAGTMSAEEAGAAATPSQATTVRPTADPAPEPTASQPAVSEPATEPATPATPEPAAPAAAPAAAAPAAADQPTAHSAAPPRGASRGDVPVPDFAPSAIRRVVPVDAPTAFTPDTQGSRRGGSAATRGGATLFTTIVIAATTAGVLIYYITEPFK
jgi:predicted component of type VI protein secretion system